MGSFAERVAEKVERSGPLVVGLDPHFDLLPPVLLEQFAPGEMTFEGLAEAVLAFGTSILEALAGEVGFVKIQMAFYEALGIPGMVALSRTIQRAKERGFLVILDGKRNDIASSAVCYAQGYLSEITAGGKSLRSFWDVDALTVNPYLGEDSLLPFFEEARKSGKGVFVLARTSNPSAPFIQDEGRKVRVFEKVALLVEDCAGRFFANGPVSSFGIVVGATYPEDLQYLRERFPRLLFLIPGVGAQGGAVEALRFAFLPGGLGALVNVSRDILFAYRKQGRENGEDFAERAREEALRYQKMLRSLMP
ncbi:orotidine-5'-phosphate decarboxylase [Candidatus Caldatribacterium sp. SIUC1]|uniref:orotidine-5'-phosphate decarboxylase n=1 Tax=Candidatus Caldatribacterium sp. SIUC1 TaxID=3418365 RepID=UPI003F68CD44